MLNKLSIVQEQSRPLDAAIVVEQGQPLIDNGVQDSVPAGAKRMISIRRNGSGGEVGMPASFVSHADGLHCTPAEHAQLVDVVMVN